MMLSKTSRLNIPESSELKGLRGENPKEGIDKQHSKNAVNRY